MKTILLTLLLASTALAEDCYQYNPNINTKITPTIEYHRFNPKRPLRVQLKRKAKTKHVDNFIYFIDRKSDSVTASFASLGLDKSFGVGKKKNVDIALLIAQGYDSINDFGAFWEDFILEDHELSVAEAMCIQRNDCRAIYRDKDLRSACFKDLKKWPENRKLLVGIGIKTFGEVVTIKMR
jgi:hypothetical protein